MEKSVLDSLFADLSGGGDAGREPLALREWFAEILRLCHGRNELAAVLDTARRFVPRPGTPTFNTPLVATASHRLALLAIHPAKPVPLHDHPGGWSAQMVLSGQLHLRLCDLEPQTATGSNLAHLRNVSERTLNDNEIGTVTPHTLNIHGLAASGGNAVLLSIQHPPCSASGQSWFFPVDPPRRGEPLLLCHRVRKKSRATRPV